jgi:transposase
VPRQPRIGRQTPLGAHDQGSRWLRQTLTESAKAAARTTDSYLAAQYARLRPRRGANRASTAVAHSILIAAWHMLQTGETDHDPGGDHYQRRDPERQTKRLVAQLERLGHTLVLQEAA